MLTKKTIFPLWIFCLTLAISAAPLNLAAVSPDLRPASRLDGATDAYSLIAEVNYLRAANGLPPYEPDGILMAVAQAHADYMASTGNVTHYGADGSRPFQRALAAGYPVGGDLSLGGFYSENIIAGYEMPAASAVGAWQGDAPHLHTMLSEDLMQVGAGVTIVDGVVYYVLDASRRAGSQPVYTPPVGGLTPGTPGPAPIFIVTSTPAADGSVTHIVKFGETLWTIAAVYKTTVDDILAANGLRDTYIYPGDTLLIRKGAPPTASQPTATSRPTFTARPTIPPTAAATASITATSSPVPTAAPEPGGGAGFGLVGGIIAAALIAAVVITLVSSRRETLR